VPGSRYMRKVVGLYLHWQLLKIEVDIAAVSRTRAAAVFGRLSATLLVNPHDCMVDVLGDRNSWSGIQCAIEHW